MNMKSALRAVNAFWLWLLLMALVIGCGRSGGPIANPVAPWDRPPDRRVMNFPNGTVQIFERDDPEYFTMADVDLASVVWGHSNIVTSTVTGDVVVFDDPGYFVSESSWVAAVAIENYPGNLAFPSRPVVRFVMDDGGGELWSMSQKFSVPVDVAPEPLECRVPRLDATYVGNGYVDVAVVFRYGSDELSAQQMLATWDLQAYVMHFSYSNREGWEYINATDITAPCMELANTAQTHPDIAYDQDTNDIYCA